MPTDDPLAADIHDSEHDKLRALIGAFPLPHVAPGPFLR